MQLIKTNFSSEIPLSKRQIFDYTKIQKINKI